MSKQAALIQLKACEAVLASAAGTEAIFYAVQGKRQALRALVVSR